MGVDYSTPLCYNKDEDKICERVDVYVLELCK